MQRDVMVSAIMASSHDTSPHEKSRQQENDKEMRATVKETLVSREGRECPMPTGGSSEVA